MCFSASVSFATGGALLGASALIYSKINLPRNSWYLASIPVIFGIHQCSEGLVWLGTEEQISPLLAEIAKYFYAIIAICFWPFYIPLAMFWYQYPLHHIPLKIIIAIGAAVGLYLLWAITIASPLWIRVNCDINSCESIAYLFKIPPFSSHLDKVYLAAVIIPFALAKNLRIRYILGPAFLGSFVLAKYLQTMDNYPSIWCYLAAIISTIIFYVLYIDSKKF